MKWLQVTYLLLLVGVSVPLLAQTDSLWRVYRMQTGSTQTNTLLKIAENYLQTNNDSVLALTHQLISLSEEQLYPRGTAEAVRITGLYHLNKSNFDSAFHFFKAAASIFEELADSLNYAKVLNNLAGVYYAQGNYQRALENLLTALRIYQRAKDKTNTARCLNNLALLYKKNQDYDKSIQMHQQAIQMKMSLGDTAAAAYNWVNIASTYISKKEFAKAIQTVQKSKKTIDKSNNRLLKGLTLINMASACLELIKNPSYQMYKDSIPIYLKQARDIGSQINNRQLIFSADFGLSKYYYLQKNYPKAIYFGLSAIEAAKISGANEELATFYKHLGTVYQAQQNFPKATQYLQQYIQLSDSLNEAQNRNETRRLQAIFEAEHQQNLIERLQQKQQLQEAKIKSQQLWTYSMTIGTILLAIIAWLIFLKKRERERQHREMTEKANEINQQKEEITLQNTQLKDALDRLSVLTNIGQNITATMNEAHLVRIIKESLEKIMTIDGIGIGVFNSTAQALEFSNFIENGETLPFHSESIFDEVQSPALRCFLENKELFMVDVAADFEKQYQRPAKAIIGQLPQTAFFIPLCIKEQPIGVMTIQSFEKNPYSEDNLILLRSLAAYVSIAVANTNTYKLLKNKTENIVDSMRYAKTIQNVLSPSKESIKQFFAESCLVYSPKDIVSGDFYWLTKLGHYLFVAVGDCTGHGIPGAFMAMIGNTLLDELIDREKNTEPAQILDLLHQRIRKVLHQDENNNKDGMDIALCRIRQLTAKSYEIIFAGAKRPFWYKLPNQHSIDEIRGVRVSLGGKQRKNQRPFVQEIIQVPSQTILYLFSDGFADQHDPSGERIGSHNLKSFLEAIADLPLSVQEEKLLDFFENHRQGAEQRDDIVFWGVKLK